MHSPFLRSPQQTVGRAAATRDGALFQESSLAGSPRLTEQADRYRALFQPGAIPTTRWPAGGGQHGNLGHASVAAESHHGWTAPSRVGATGVQSVAQLAGGQEAKERAKEEKRQKNLMKSLFSRRAQPTQSGGNRLAQVGSVSAHEVKTGMFEVAYPSGTGPGYKGFLKQPARVGDSVTESERNLGLEENDGRLSEDPRMVARSVASSRLDQALGLNVLAQEDFACDRSGKFIGGVSAGVPGHALVANRGRSTPKAPQIQEHHTIDPSHPETQRTAANLQLIDFITGQSDRHQGNMFYDPSTGRLTGIDNDQAFGDPGRMPLTSAHDMDLGAMPVQIDQATADRLMRFKPKQIAKLLRGSKKDPERLNKAEILAACGRFEQVQDAIRLAQSPLPPASAPKIVSRWDNATLTAAGGQDAKNNYRSYLGRYQDRLPAAKNERRDGWLPEVASDTGLPLGRKAAKMYVGTLPMPTPAVKALLMEAANRAESGKAGLHHVVGSGTMQDRRNFVFDSLIERARRSAPRERKGDDAGW